MVLDARFLFDVNGPLLLKQSKASSKAPASRRASLIFVHHVTDTSAHSGYGQSRFTSIVGGWEG
jgi:hypothetical protein